MQMIMSQSRFLHHELVARVKAHLARYERLIGSATPENDIVEIRGIKIEQNSPPCVGKRRGKAVTTKEFDLLIIPC